MSNNHHVPLFQPHEAIFEEDKSTPLASVSRKLMSNSSILTHTSNTQLRSDPHSLPPSRHLFQWPSCYRTKDRTLVRLDKSTGSTRIDNLSSFIKQDLDVTRLNNVHKHLWLAGLPLTPRSLHRQVLMGRHITITEQCDLHLLWRGTELYLKPLPDYLLSHATWTEILCLPSNHHIYELAAGLLYSYIGLVMSRSDLHIAHKSGLLPETLTWHLWTSFTSAVLTTLSTVPHHNNTTATPMTINRRYIHGELRLTRLNLIYRLCTPQNFLTGYHHPYTSYSTFFAGNFAWVVTVVVYVTVVLTAMQVGLATEQLQPSRTFNRASFGFTVFAIVGPLAVVGVMGVFALVLVAWNLRFALGRRKDARVGDASMASRGGGGGSKGPKGDGKNVVTTATVTIGGGKTNSTNSVAVVRDADSMGSIPLTNVPTSGPDPRNGSQLSQNGNGGS